MEEGLIPLSKLYNHNKKASLGKPLLLSGVILSFIVTNGFHTPGS